MPHRSSQHASDPSAPSRRERKKERTRQEIHGAAMKLFTRSGYEAVTIEAICDAADVARGTFFLHFPSKAALLFELDRRLAAELAEQLREPRGSAVGEYRTMLDLFGARWRAHSDVMGAMLRELLSTGGAGPAQSEGRDLHSLVAEIVRRGQRRGEFRRNLSPRLAAAMFLTTSAAILSGTVYREGEATPEEIRNQLLHALLHGLHEPKPRLKWKPPGDRELR